MKQTISVMLDCSRNAVPNKEFLKVYIDMLAKCGYNQLQLYVEDTYTIEGEPYFGYFRGRFTPNELKELDDYAFSKGIELIPAIQVLGHLSTIFLWGEYSRMQDFGDCLLAGEEKTYELIDKMLKTVSETFGSKNVNIGMDEAFGMGKGNYLLKHGYRNPDDIYIEHLNRVSKLLEKHGLHGMMWGDMFYRNMNKGEYYTKTPIVSENTRKLIPNNVDIIYWDYYNFDKEIISAMATSAIGLNKNAYYAGGVWSWVGFIPNNEFAIAQTKAAIDVCKKAGINNFINTAWGDNGAESSKLASLPALFYFAELVKGVSDDEVIKKHFLETFNFEMDDLIELDKLNGFDPHADHITNVCKYMLYSDYLMGIYDFSVDSNKVAFYKDLKEKLFKGFYNEAFSYVFKEAYALADVLELKYDMGVRIRKAYKSHDTLELKHVIYDLEHLIPRLEAFYESFKEMWYKENKLEGFEIQTARIGGVILRTKEVINLLKDYVSGKIKEIGPLEQDILKFEGMEEGKDICCNTYFYPTSVNTH